MLQTLYKWYGKRTVWGVLLVVAALVVFGVTSLAGDDNQTAEATEASLPRVAVATAANLSGDTSVTVIGQVEAINRAVIESEVGGRVVAVNVALGDRIGAGQIIAQLENAAERAAVLQAEGVYEAAVAAAAQSDLGVAEAENNVQLARNSLAASINDAASTYRSAYSTANDTVLNTMDQFFSNPTEGLTIGLRIGGEGRTSDLIEARRQLRTTLATVRDRSLTLSSESDMGAELDDVETLVRDVLGMVDDFIVILPEAEPTPRFTQADLNAAQTAFSAARSALSSQLNAIDRARTAIANAEEGVANAEQALERARIGSTNQTVSASDAQVKQALGSLRAAQARLADTIIRSPIAGEVNSLEVQTGDFIGPRDQIAVVANNNALEITAFVGEADRARIAVGDEVTIGTDIAGVITTIAPAIDQATGKTEIKIQTTSDMLQTGDTVNVRISDTTTETSDTAAVPTTILLPITAVRFTAEDGFVFTIENSKLVRTDVTLGRVRGSQVEVLTGISGTTEVVVDARGLAAGQEVEVTR